jgi:hypothetical protein
LAAGWVFWLILPAVLVKWALKGRHYGDMKRVYFRMLGHALWDGLFRRKIRSHGDIVDIMNRD